MEKVAVLQVQLGDWKDIPFESSWTQGLAERVESWVTLAAHMDQAVIQMGLKPLESASKIVVVVEDFGKESSLPMPFMQALFQWMRGRRLTQVYLPEVSGLVHALRILPPVLKTKYTSLPELRSFLQSRLP
jgi:hypothetical protein